VKNALVFGGAGDGPARESSGSNASGEDHTIDTPERLDKRCGIGQIAPRDLDARTKEHFGTPRIAGQNPDRSSVVAQSDRRVPSGRSGAPDDQYERTGHVTTKDISSTSV
jgi:hypothetical protein